MTASSYQTPEDRKYARILRKLAPEQFDAYRNLSDTSQGNVGEIPVKYRELIAIAVGLANQCGYCLETHTEKAKRAGATEGEMAETIFVAASLGAGAMVLHGLMTMRMFDEVDAE